jgi:hypothetical protein
MTPEERSKDEVWEQIAAHADDEDEYDATELVDTFGARVDEQPSSYRWSYARQLGPHARLVVVDSRAARVLDEHERSMLDDHEMAWLDEQMRGDVDHLLIGTSLPFLLSPGLHYVEAWDETLTSPKSGPRRKKAGERMRTALDLEHWAAFQDGFQRVMDMALAVARGERGQPPRTITFLSGDVHHSYVSEARPKDPDRPIHSRIIQAVCSPIRNPMPRRLRFLVAVLAYGVAGPIGHLVARSAKVPEIPVRWKLLKGPWFDNNLATLEVTDDGLRMWWATGQVENDEHHRPRLKRVAELTIE